MKLLPCLLFFNLLLSLSQLTISEVIGSKQGVKSGYFSDVKVEFYGTSRIVPLISWKYSEIHILNSDKPMAHSRLNVCSLRKESLRYTTSHKEWLWKHGIIPYEFDTNYFPINWQGPFLDAMRHWENYTCLKFVQRRPELHPDYIFFTALDKSRCYSDVIGRLGGKQNINIGEFCYQFGIIVHEIGHAIGFHHEQQRPDRDNYVQIFHENVETGEENQFKLLDNKEVDSLGEPYDYDSIMHYGPTAFARNDTETMVPIRKNGNAYVYDPYRIIGQIARLSEGDIRQTNKLYNCTNSNVEVPKKDCNIVITATYGKRIKSPLIKDTQMCYLNIVKDPQFNIIVKFTRMDFECNNKNDWFSVYSLPYNKPKTLLGWSSCYENKQNEYTSKDNLEIILYAENSVPKQNLYFTIFLEKSHGAYNNGH